VTKAGVFATVDVERIRDEIQRILSAAKYDAPQPSQLGGWWRRTWFRILDWIDGLVSGFPGGPALFYGLLALVVVGLAVYATLRLGRRRNRQIEALHFAQRASERGLDPREIEQRADRAAAGGDYREAVRLRFLAGLLRLDERKAIAFRPGITSAEVSAILRSPAYDQLAGRFDAIVYGDDLADLDDHQHAVDGWRRVLETAST
jgi:hypothetical protein